MDTYPDYLCDFKEIAYFNCSYILYDNDIHVEPKKPEVPEIIAAAEKFGVEVEEVLWNLTDFKELLFFIFFVFIIIMLTILKKVFCDSQW